MNEKRFTEKVREVRQLMYAEDYEFREACNAIFEHRQPCEVLPEFLSQEWDEMKEMMERRGEQRELYRQLNEGDIHERLDE